MKLCLKGVNDLEENKAMKSLFDECLAYIKYGQDINPIHVKDMLRKAYEAGKNEGAKELMDFLDDPPILGVD
jgi:hypothetical protein